MPQNNGAQNDQTFESLKLNPLAANSLRRLRLSGAKGLHQRHLWLGVDQTAVNKGLGIKKNTISIKKDDFLIHQMILQDHLSYKML